MIFSKIFLFLSIISSQFIADELSSINEKEEGFFSIEDVLKMPQPFPSKSNYERIFTYGSIVPISKDKGILVFYYESFYKTNWMEKDKIKEEGAKNKGLIKSIKLEKFEDETYLIIFNLNNSYIYSISPPYKGSNKAIPLVMDENGFCPYAIYVPNDKNLICYDFTLSEKKRIKIPINSSKTKVIFDGENHKIFFLNDEFSKNGKIGSYYILEKNKWEDFSFNQMDLIKEINEKALNIDGEKNESKLQISEIDFMDDYGNNPGFYLWIEAVDKKDKNKELKHYFTAEIENNMINKVEQNNFWIYQGAVEKENKEIDRKKGIIYLPGFVSTRQRPKAFILNKNEYLYYYVATYGVPDKDGNISWEGGLPVLKYFIYFPSKNSSPIMSDFYDLYDKLCEDDIVIFHYIERVDKDTFLFSGVKDKKGEREDVIVKLKFNKPS